MFRSPKSVTLTRTTQNSALADKNARLGMKDSSMATMHSILEQLIRHQVALINKFLNEKNHDVNEKLLQNLRNDLNIQKEALKSHDWKNFDTAIKSEASCLADCKAASEAATALLESWYELYHQKIKTFSSIKTTNDDILRLQNSLTHRSTDNKPQTITRARSHSAVNSLEQVNKQKHRPRAMTFNGKRKQQLIRAMSFSHTQKSANHTDNTKAPNYQPSKQRTSSRRSPSNTRATLFKSPKFTRRLFGTTRQRSNEAIVRVSTDVKIVQCKTTQTSNLVATRIAEFESISSSNNNPVRQRANTAPVKASQRPGNR